MAKELHPIIKAAGYPDEKSFYRDFPTEEHFNSYMKTGGRMMQAGGFVTPDATGRYQGNMGQGVGIRPIVPINPSGPNLRVFPSSQGNGSMINSFANMPPMQMPQGSQPNNTGWSGAPLQGASGSGVDEYGCVDDLNNYKAPGMEVDSSMETAKTGGSFSPDKKGYHWDGQKMIKTKGTGTYNQGTYFKDGGFYTAKELKETPDNWAKNGGSIHINPANKGKFNATKKATGKSTEELTHSSNPITKKRAIFAQNASHWNKKEYGGVSGDTDDTIYDAGGNVFAMGGRVNPFHPLAQYMRGGQLPKAQYGDYTPAKKTDASDDTVASYQIFGSNRNGPGDESPDQAFADTGIAPATPKAQTLNADGTVKQDDGPVNIPNDPDRGSNTWRQGMTDQDANTQLQQHTTPPGTYTPPVTNNNGVRRQGYNDMLGAGVAVASGFEAMKNNRWQKPGQDRTLIVNAQGHGREDQFGNRAPGSTYAQQAVGKFGGFPFEDGGNTDSTPQYKKGQVLDLSEEEINQLTRQGFKLAKA